MNLIKKHSEDSGMSHGSVHSERHPLARVHGGQTKSIDTFLWIIVLGVTIGAGAVFFYQLAHMTPVP